MLDCVRYGYMDILNTEFNPTIVSFLRFNAVTIPFLCCGGSKPINRVSIIKHSKLLLGSLVKRPTPQLVHQLLGVRPVSLELEDRSSSFASVSWWPCGVTFQI